MNRIEQQALKRLLLRVLALAATVSCGAPSQPAAPAGAANTAPAPVPPSALRWAADAALEHSSIAAFAKLSLDLMAHGAPLDLVRAAHQAALEEIRHTEAACAMATAAG